MLIKVYKVYLDSQTTEQEMLETASAIRQLRGVTAVEIVEDPILVPAGPIPKLDPENHFERSVDAQTQPES